MKFVDNTLLITPNHIKNKVLKELETQPLIDVSFISLPELSQRLTFSYTKQSIHYITTKYQVKHDVALIYLQNLKYITQNYQSEKLHFLYSLKQELTNEGLLVSDELFKSYLTTKKLVVYGYDYISSYDKILLSDYQYQHYTFEDNKNTNFKVYEFDDIEAEIRFVATKICELLEQGIDINRIKLTGTSNEYYYLLDLIFGFYNIPINLELKTPIYDTVIGKRFLELLEDNIDKTLDILKQEYPNESDIYNKIIRVLNQYQWSESFHDCKDALIYEFKHTYKTNVLYDNAVNLVELEDNYFDDEYVFVLGFQQSQIPRIYKDEDFLNDELKTKLGIEDSLALNKIAKAKVILGLKRITNLFISYKLKTNFQTYYPSNLINDLQMDVIREHNHNYQYSHRYNRILLTKYLDDLIKFGVINDDIHHLYYMYNPRYLEYQNEFTGINPQDLYKYLDDKLNLSYTSIDKYYKCGFMFYLSNILKLDIYEENFAMFIGNLFHYVLSQAFNQDFDFNKTINDYIEASTYKLDAKEQFLLEKLKQELQFVIQVIEEQYQSLGYKDVLCEEKITLSKDRNIKITFTGIIDKIMYKKKYDPQIDDELTYIALIDYKTGGINTKFDYLEYGLNLQLPVYLYLAKNTNKLKNVRVYGFYFQKVLLNEFKANPKKDYKEIRVGELKLQGYTLADCSTDFEFDLTKNDSQVIKSLRVKKDGSYYQYAKVLTPHEMDDIYHLAEQKIDQAIDDILDAKFSINPKRIEQTNISCQYCQFKDICYVSERNIITLDGEKNEMDN